jgi:predicted PurR-regulated permease PerM
LRRAAHGHIHGVRGTTGWVLVVSLVAGAVLVGARAFWQLRVLLALLFLSYVLAAAIRPTVDALRRHGVPRPLGVALHYLALAAVAALVLWLVVPGVLHQLQAALAQAPHSRGELHRQVAQAHGWKHAVLQATDEALRRVPSAGVLLHGAWTVGTKTLAILFGIAFVVAAATYWVFERESAEKLVLRLVPPERRPTVRATWRLVEAKLGAFVRGQLTMITFVSTVLSLAFWRIGLPYFLLLGGFAGIVEILPVVGPLFAAGAAIGVGFTVSPLAAGLAAIAVWGLRVLQDYLIGPRVLGHAVGLPALLVLVNVTAVGILLGPALVPLATPLAAVAATAIEVVVLGKDPTREQVPRVLLPARRG